ncbi:FAD binding domain-containing protein [Candidatus Uabimicrobium sp. HlEnr_7]|uniref:FAD binding domain-containing protein n=1 Tax=Candidatus Uabimicrobium helgolandensis TaxID=3095367 RepID=UPI0035588EAF
MIKFILNDQQIESCLPPQTVVLDFLRQTERIKSCKESCRTGGCGSCLVLLSNKKANQYHSVNSCLLTLGEASGKHLVTIEGFKQEKMNYIQQAMVEQHAAQCGYCTVGFIVALAAFLLEAQVFTVEQAIRHLDGNICRCTGYQSIKRAVAAICEEFSTLENKTFAHRLGWLVEKQIIPKYFFGISKRLQEIQDQRIEVVPESNFVFIAGGTDLLLQDKLPENLVYLSNRDDLKQITNQQQTVYIGSAVTITNLQNSAVIHKNLPAMSTYLDQIASKPIRNSATIGGNIVSAAPTADICVIFLALQTTLLLNNKQKTREVLLEDFFLGKRKVDKHPHELLEQIIFSLPQQNTFFNFEKIAKRSCFDTATVNSAINIKMEKETIREIDISFGGVASKPILLQKTMDFLKNKMLTVKSIQEANNIAQLEISPTDDIRGSSQYKRLLVRQLIYAHFLKLFPKKIQGVDLF